MKKIIIIILSIFLLTSCSTYKGNFVPNKRAYKPYKYHKPKIHMKKYYEAKPNLVY